MQLWSIPHGTFGVSFFNRGISIKKFLFGESTHQTAKQKNEKKKNTQNIMLVKLNKTTKLIYNILNNN